MGPKLACFGAFSTTFRFPKSELASTHGHANAQNIHILENFCKFDQNVHFGESEPIGAFRDPIKKTMHIIA